MIPHAPYNEHASRQVAALQLLTGKTRVKVEEKE